jgi:peptidoglycan/xylan/chitin deacetylase (PgdA/CDA1 family)
VLAALLAGMGNICHVWAGSPAVVTSGDSSKRAVALTFDDGPSPLYTPRVLALLRHYKARGTFFVLGRKVEENPGLIKNMLAAGHEVGNHTYSHPHLPRIDHLARTREMERTRVLLDLLGCPRHDRIMRPPYSEYDQRLVSYLEHTDRDMILWNVDSGDWRGLATPAIVRNVLGQVKNGAIIIFHDSDENDRADRTPTVEALKIILPALEKAGYRMVTVSELLD